MRRSFTNSKFLGVLARSINEVAPKSTIRTNFANTTALPSMMAAAPLNVFPSAFSLPAIHTQRQSLTTHALHRELFDELPKICPQFDQNLRKAAVKGWLDLNFDDTYLASHSSREIAEHIKGFILSEIQHAGPGADLDWKGECNYVSLKPPTEGGATYICNYKDRRRILFKIERYVAKHEHLMDKYAVSIRSYNSTYEEMKEDSICLFTVKFDPFTDPTGTRADLAGLTSEKFMKIRSEGSKKRYQELLDEASKTIVPASKVYELREGVHALHIAFSADRPTYLFALNNLIENNMKGSSIVKQFFETFSNGRQVYTVYVKGANPLELGSVASSLHMLPSRPNDPVMEMYNENLLNPEETIFCFSAVIFAYYFTPPAADEDINELRRNMRNDPAQLKRFNAVYGRLFQEVMKEKHIGMAIREDIPLFKKIYNLFLNSNKGTSIDAEASAIEAEIAKNYFDDGSTKMLWKTMVTFVRCVRATNFFKAQRAGVSFRLDPIFLKDLGVPRIPYAIYMVVGSTFRGFHIRFHDIARGGIRMIVPRSKQDYGNKKHSLFQENYNLSYTQMLKNKDIPESGSKGTILLSPRYDPKKWSKKTLFLQYVQSLLDIMIPGVPKVRSSLKEPEVLFLGPDENTAGDFPSTAAHFARAAGYTQWKSLTTGKKAEDGGIPHDTYGMTTTSVRAYVEGIYEKLGLDETKLKKFQTGGPDGDLGSNEILMGKEQWTGICDGSGCLFDLKGLNYDELKSLAVKRLPISHYNKALLSKEGAFVPIDATNVKLPDGTMVASGATFLAEFHFTKYVRADVFVPCGGRPNSVTLQNVGRLIDMKGITGDMLLEGGVTVPPSALHFKYIVEGANLFITPDARVALENAGVVVFKDASANKGGVTSSSVEVFCGLAMNDEQFLSLMCCKDGVPSPFYAQVTKEIVKKIKDNARKEFNAIWEDAKAGHGGGSRTTISDVLSKKIVEISEFVAESKLMKDSTLFRYVIHDYCPPTLLKEVPLDALMQRVPQAYLRAIFCKSLASDYVYTYGVTANEFSFFEYMNNLQKRAETFAASEKSHSAISA